MPCVYEKMMEIFNFCFKNLSKPDTMYVSFKLSSAEICSPFLFLYVASAIYAVNCVLMPNSSAEVLNVITLGDRVFRMQSSYNELKVELSFDNTGGLIITEKRSFHQHEILGKAK